MKKLFLLKTYKMKKVILVALLFISKNVFAQDFKLGNVSVAELKEEQHSLEPEAPAAILYKKGNTSFDFNSQGHWILVTDVKVRIKIYKNEGLKYANIEIPYYVGGANDEEVKISDVVTYNLIEGKVHKTKLADEGEFTEEANSKWKIKKIILPEVKEGSVIEYHYVIKSSYITNFNDWYFQYSIPVNYIEYGAYIPALFVYNRILSPYVPIKEKQGSEKVTKRYTDTNNKGGYGQATSLGQNETGQISFYEARRTYIAENVPSLKGEEFVDNIQNYRSFVKHELASSHMPGEPEKKYASDWNSVAKSVYDDKGFGVQLKDDSFYKEELREVLKGKEKMGDIVLAVFDFVKTRMVWNGQYGYISNKGLNRAYIDKTGNIADINLMLVSMLRHAGLKANPILLSTRDNGHVSFVNRNEFNYVIAGVELADRVLYLDASSKYASPEILPFRDLNTTGRLIRENFSTNEVDLMPKVNSKENVIVMANIAEDGTLNGQVRSQYYDHMAYRWRENNSGLSTEAYVEKIEKNKGGIIVDNIEITNKDEVLQPVVENFAFTSDRHVDIVDGKMYLSPLLFYTFTENPFKQEKRSYPIDFGFPQQEKYTVTITVPEGYKVESAPEAVSLTAKDGVSSFRYNIVNRGRQIQVAVTKDINYARINPEYYETIKEFYNGIVKKETEKIVLIKQ